MKPGPKPGSPRIPGSGRKPGTPNKRSVAIKEALERAFEEMGGIEALVKWGKESPDNFYPIWAKLLPRDINLSGSLDIAEAIQAARLRLIS